MNSEKQIKEVNDTLGKINRSILSSFRKIAYGEIYYAGTGFDTVLAAQDTWCQILGFDTNGENQLTIPDHSNDHIVISKAGKYKVSFSNTSRSGAANEYVYAVKKNNGASIFPNTEAHRVTSSSGRVANGSVSAICDLAVNDTIEAWVKRLDGGAVSKTLTIEHIVLNVVKIS